MPSLYESVVEQFGGPVLRDRFSASVPVDDGYVDGIVEGVAPGLLAAAHRRVDRREQAEELIRVIDQVGLAPRSLATGLPDRIESVGSTAVDAVFGSGRRRLPSELARHAGVTPGVVVAAAPWLAAAVMTAMASRRWAGGLDVAGIRLLLQGEVDSLRQAGLLAAEPPSPLPPAAAVRPAVPGRFRRPVPSGRRAAGGPARFRIRTLAG